MVEETKKYSLGVVGSSSTKRRCSNVVKLDDAWILILGVVPTSWGWA